MNIAAAVQDGEAHSSLCASEMLYLTLAYDWLIYGLVLYSSACMYSKLWHVIWFIHMSFHIRFLCFESTQKYMCGVMFTF